MIPRGELFISTEKIISSDNLCGKVMDSQNPFYGYADAFVRYGLTLSEGAIDKLMAPLPHKEPAGTKSAVKHGVAYIGATVGKIDERVLSLDVNIIAKSRGEYLRRYKLFCDEVLSGCVVYVRTIHRPALCYRLLYQSSEQFRQWMPFGVAMFTLSFIEPHPELQPTLPSILPTATLVLSPHTGPDEQALRTVNGTDSFVATMTVSGFGEDCSVVWESSNEAAASVSANGASATVTWLAAGRVTITASASIGGYVLASDQFNANVSDTPGPGPTEM